MQLHILGNGILVSQEKLSHQPRRMGFDEWLSRQLFEMDPVLSRNGGPPKQFFGESSEILIDEAIDYIKTRPSQDSPFFSVIWFGSPHEPYSGLETDLLLYQDLRRNTAIRPSD